MWDWKNMFVQKEVERMGPKTSKPFTTIFEDDLYV
jgi:hypothetical protein